MINVLFVFLMALGLLFVLLGLLFINYEISPLKKIVAKEYVYTDHVLGIKIILPGLILMGVSWLIIFN